MKTTFIDYEDRDPTLAQVRRLADDAAKVPLQPAAPHLDDEELFRLGNGTLSSRSRVLGHVETCPDCARLAEEALHEFEGSWVDIENERGRPMSTVAAAVSPVERDEWLRVDLPVAMFASGRELYRGLATRAVEWQSSLSDPSLSCALDDEYGERSGDRFVFRVRTSNAEWSASPLRFVIRDTATDSIVADAWVVLHPDADHLTGFTGHASVSAPRPGTWSAWVARSVFVASSPPGYQEIERLRRVIGAADQRDRAVWRAWLDREAAEGRLSERIRAELLARL